MHTTEWDREDLRTTLQQIMERADLSQAAIGQLAGRNRTMASRWLSGQSRPAYEAAVALAAAIDERHPSLAPLTARFLRAAGYAAGDNEAPRADTEDVDIAAKRLLGQLREVAHKEDKSIGDILVERGLATIDELTVSEEKRGDKYVADILASNMPEDTKNHLLLNYALNRRQSFREEGIIGPPKTE